MITDIVIPVRNALEHLRVCVDAVARTVSDYRLILVDDASDDPTKAFLREVQVWRPNTLIIIHGKQKWFSRTSNDGLRLTRTEWSVLLNSDAIPRAGWLDELYDVRDTVSRSTGQQIGLVGSDLVRGHDSRYELTREPDYVTGHCLLLNRKAMYDLSCYYGTPGSPFNEIRDDCVHINSDRFMSYHLNQLGYLTVRSRHSEVDHVGGASWRNANGYHDLEAVGKLRLVDVDN